MPSYESPTHLELKRLALIWAQANGYAIAACEVALPNLRFRLDVGAYRPGVHRELREDARLKTKRLVRAPAIGVVSVFECKASRADFIRDSRNSERLLARIKVLTERRHTLESLLKIHYPTLHHGDGLWPEYHTFDFSGTEHAPYRKVIRELQTLGGQLHGQTKLHHLMQWQSANLHYLVVEPNLLKDYEMPIGWGLLARDGDRLLLRQPPEWRNVDESARLGFLHRLAVAGTKATNREAGVDYASIANERNGLSPEVAARRAASAASPPF